MAFSNFQHGFKNGVTIRGVPVELAHPGKVFWVGNNATRLDNEATAADGNDGTFLRPFSTIMGAYANSAVTASRGDVIFVRPGYTETLSSASLWTLNKAGVCIIGLGAGSARPTITLSAATATITVSAASQAIRNCVFVANADDVAALFTLTTGNHLSVEDCRMADTSTSLNFLVLVDTNTTTNDADGLYFARNVVQLLKAQATIIPFQVDGINDRWQIVDNYITTDSVATGGVIRCAAAKYLTGLKVTGNFIRTAGTDNSTGIVMSGGTTGGSLARGLIADNTLGSLDTSASSGVTVAASITKVVKAMNRIAGTNVSFLKDAEIVTRAAIA